MKRLEGKKVLVTGAAGFIYSNLVDTLLDEGAFVIGIDNMYNGKMQNLELALKHPHFEFLKVDVRDYDRLLHVVKDVDIVFHGAAFTSVPQSILMPQLCNEVNVIGSLNILNVARINKVKKIIFASSSSVYGDTEELPKHEKMALDPISPYAVSKLAAESYMVAYNRCYGIDTTCLRYFNVFGSRQKDSPYSGVIAIFMSKIFSNQNPVIFGDGNQFRDFTYVKDVIEANILAALNPDSAGRVINVASGRPIKLTELTQKMIDFADKKHLKIEYTEPRKGDILNSFGDISLAKEILNFEAKYHAISGLQEYMDSFRSKYNK